MKHNTKKGFTLVELLVVIAILAILATVSVVGYTSFIERATVSNDQNIAAQLNQFLDAVKADSKGPYYEELQKNGITADNVNEITDFILSDSGLNTLVPQAEQYGYHFYYDLDAKQYVVLHDDEAVDAPTGFEAFLKPTAAGKPNTLSVSNCFTQDGRYCLVDTESTWAKLLNRYNEITSKEDLQKLYDDAQAMVNEHKSTIPGFAYLIETTTFVTEKGNFVVKVDVEHNAIVVQNAATLKEDGSQNEYILTGTLVDLFGNSVDISITNPLFTPSEEKEYVIELPEDVGYIAPNFATVKNPEKEVPNEDGTTSTAPSFDVTITLGQNTAEEIEEIVEIGMKVEGVEIETNNGESVTIADDKITVGETTLDVTEKNKVTDFKISVSHTNSNKVNASENTGYIAWDGKTFTFSASDFVGSPDYPGAAVTSEAVNWTITNVKGDADANGNPVDYTKYVSIPNGVLTLTADDNGYAPAINEIEVTAIAAAGGYYETYLLKVVRLIGIADVTLGNEKLNLDGEDSLVLYNDRDNNNVNISFVLNFDKNKGDYNYEDSGVTPDVNLTIVNNNDEIKLFNNDTEFALAEGLDELLVAKTISIKIDNLHSKDVDVRVFSSDNLNFVVNTDYSKINLVGDKNTIKLSDLFDKNENMGIPADAQIWFGSGFGGTVSVPGDIDTTTYAESVHGTVTNINAADWANTEIQFLNGLGSKEEAEATEVYVAIVIPNDPEDPSKGGRRISATRKISVVEGYNIDAENYATVIANESATTSFVLWSDITMTADKNLISLNNLYGNNFKYDITAGSQKPGDQYHTGIISFHGTIRDVKIVGAVYPQLALQVDTLYGTPAVCAESNNCKVINSYIANCRAPLRLDASCTVENSVFYGGRYANIDITTGTLTIKGHVTTIQQMEKSGNEDVLGMGISCWFNDINKYIVVDTGAQLEQLNFVSKDHSSAMPVLSLRPKEDVGIDLSWLGINELELIDTADIFESLLSNSTKYGNHFFYDENDNNKQYINVGTVALDKYFYNMSSSISTHETVIGKKECIREHNADGTAKHRGNCCSKDGCWHIVGCKLEDIIESTVSGVTITTEQYTAISASFTIEYPTDKFTCSLDSNGTGVVTVTDWTEGTQNIVFTVKDGVEINPDGYDLWTDFNFCGTSNVQMIINDGKGMSGYDSVEYVATVNNSLVDLAWDYVAGKLASVGLHSKTVVIDIHAPLGDVNEDLFNTYLGAVESGHYKPTNTATFDANGNINFYVYEAPAQGE